MTEDKATVSLEEWVNAACGAVVDALHEGSVQRRIAVARQIADVEEQLPAELDDLATLLQALQALLAGTPPAVASENLSDWYAEVFQRVVEAIEDEPGADHTHHEHEHPDAVPEGQRMSLGEALEQITQDTINVLREGSPEDQAQMAQGFELLRFQARQVMEWPAFAEFLQAVQNLLRGKEVNGTHFEPPFDQAWARVSEQLPVDSEQ